jgi:hypothetical protein
MRGGRWVLITIATALSIATATVIFLATETLNQRGENAPSWNDIGKQTAQNYVINVTDSISIEHK